MDDEDRRGEKRRDHLKLILKSATGDPLGFIVLAVLSDCGPGNDYPPFTTSEHETGSLENYLPRFIPMFLEIWRKKSCTSGGVVVLGCCGHFI